MYGFVADVGLGLGCSSSVHSQAMSGLSTFHMLLEAPEVV